jgi:hypothetical protein
MRQVTSELRRIADTKRTLRRTGQQPPPRRCTRTAPASLGFLINLRTRANSGTWPIGPSFPDASDCQSDGFGVNAESDIVRPHHVLEVGLQRLMKQAVQLAKVSRLAGVIRCGTVSRPTGAGVPVANKRILLPLRHLLLVSRSSPDSDVTLCTLSLPRRQHGNCKRSSFSSDR